MSKVILVVDDSETIRHVVASALREHGFSVLEAEDGVDALSHCNGQKIHLVISDLNMPNLDGIGFVREMKTRQGYRFTPVMILTTENSVEKRAEGKSAGASGWMVKPFDAARVLSAVKKLILA
ncbi:response regulator [Vibrio alginolyticus]|nr:response regulator [Vibrio alginolyticus]